MKIMRFWFNAFIPRTVAGYTRVLSSGPHAGKTAIPLPGAARLWPGNSFKHLDAGFLTDQREFSSVYGASSRMISMVDVNLDTMTMVQQSHKSSGTTQVDLVTGAQTGFGKADMSRCEFKVPTGPGLLGLSAHMSAGRDASTIHTEQMNRSTAMSLALNLRASAGDPLVGMAADIDYLGTVRFQRHASGDAYRVSFDGKIDAFPAYDCYASIGSQVQTLFTSSPPAGNTVVDLLGPANRPVSGTVTFRR